MTLRLRKRSLFPALVTAQSPIILTKSGVQYDFSIDMDALESATGINSKISGPLSSLAGNLAFFSDTTGTRLDATPSSHAGNPSSAALYSPLAIPAAGNGTYNGLQVGIGTAVTAADVPLPTDRMIQGIVGTAVVPLAETSMTAYGVMGYGQSDSTTLSNAIGVGGWGFANNNTASVWALAGSIHNKPFAASVGLDANSMVIMELDVNIWKKAAGAEPAIAQLHGLLIAGSGDSTANQGDAILINKLNVSTGAKWANAFNSQAGAAVNALVAGPVASSGTVLNSQPVIFQGVNGAGTVITSKIYADGGGDIFVQSPASGSVVLGDGNLNYLSTTPSGGAAKVVLNALSGGAAGIITNTTTGLLGTTPTAAGIQTFFGTPTSANLAAAITDEVSAAGVSAKALFGTAGNLPATATNDSAAAGNVGEYVEGILTSGSATSLTTGTDKTVVSISLTAGDWDVDGIANFVPAGTTSITQLIGSISLTTNAVDVTPGRASAFFFPAFVPGGSFQSTPVPNYRISLSTTTTVYLVVRGTFTVSTLAAYGIIRARRSR